MFKKAKSEMVSLFFYKVLLLTNKNYTTKSQSCLK